MNKDRILVVEDDAQTAEYIKTYFNWQGYEVLTAARGEHALATCRLSLPNAIILDIMLPDANGYDVCRTLRSNSRTSHIPIIFLSHRNKRNDIIFAFEVGADDFIAKPFDIEELKLRVEGTIRHSRRGVLRHPVTNLPAGELIVEQLRAIKDSPESWSLLYFGLKNFDLFQAVAKTEAANTILVNLADILREAIETYGTRHDFIGQASNDGFVVVTIPEATQDICQLVSEKFRAESLSVAQAIGLLKLTINAVSSYDGPFADIREITQTLARLGVDEPELGLLDELQTLHSQAADIYFCNQLSEQVALWKTSPQLAKALIEVERLTTTKLPDLNKIKVLLELAEESDLPPDVLERLRMQQRLCRLAGQNLDELQYKIRSYHKFERAKLVETLSAAAKLLQKPSLKISTTVENLRSTLSVALPALQLQQVIYNVCRWLIYEEPKPELIISAKLKQETASLCFSLAKPTRGPADPATLLQALHRQEGGAVYGYLAHKVVTRYGGHLKLAGDWLLVELPLAQPGETTSGSEVETLRQEIREQRLFLDRQPRPRASVTVFEMAADLIDPLAEDLLAKIETLLITLNTHSGIEIHAYPWSAIQRYCHLSRLLALDLRKNRPLIPAPVNLKSLLESIRPMLAHRLLNQEIIIESEVDRPVVNTDKTRLSQIFVNLALNALEAMPEDGILKFRISSADDYIGISVIDTGRGISPESIPYIFDPHFTTKEAGRGLGLHNVNSYVKQLHGQIEVTSEMGQGTTVTVKLPPTWGAGYF